jgi:hypothetical protein
MLNTSRRTTFDNGGPCSDSLQNELRTLRSTARLLRSIPAFVCGHEASHLQADVRIQMILPQLG